MSDAAKPLSIKVIKGLSGETLIEQRGEFEARLLKNSLNWPKAYLDEVCGAANHFFYSSPLDEESRGNRDG